MIRLRISDYYRDPILEPIFYKTWKLLVGVQYEPLLLKGVSHLGHIPLAIDIYERLISVFQLALGVYYQSTYYVAKRPIYKAETVFFDRFCYDYISLFGVNILFLEIKDLEMITRRIYSNISYNFDKEVMKGVKAPPGQGGLRLLALECIQPVFTQQELLESQKNLQIKSGKISKTTLPNVYKSSETDFIEKVNREKREARGGMSPTERSEATKSIDGGSNDGNSSPQRAKGNVFANAMDPLKMEAEK